MSVIGKQIESCSEYLKKIHKINKNYFSFIRLPPSWKWGYKSCNVCDMIQILRSLLTKPLIIIMKWNFLSIDASAQLLVNSFNGPSRMFFPFAKFKI